MSDINLDLYFPWYSWPLILAMMGWPGLLFGGFLGGLIAAGLRGAPLDLGRCPGRDRGLPSLGKLQGLVVLTHL